MSDSVLKKSAVVQSACRAIAVARVGRSVNCLQGKTPGIPMKLPGLNHGNERHPTTHALFGSARLHAWGARDAGWHLIIEDIPSVTKIRHVRNKRIVIARIAGFVLLAGAGAISPTACTCWGAWARSSARQSARCFTPARPRPDNGYCARSSTVNVVPPLDRRVQLTLPP